MASFDGKGIQQFNFDWVKWDYLLHYLAITTATATATAVAVAATAATINIPTNLTATAWI